MNRSYPLTASAMVPGFFSYARSIRHCKIRDTKLYHMTLRVSRTDWIATVTRVHCCAVNWLASCRGIARCSCSSAKDICERGSRFSL